MTAPAAIRADLHNHTFYSPDSILSPKDLVRKCRERGVTCVAVTDHNTVRGGLAAREIADPAALTVVVGEEVRTSEGEILGLFLKEDIPRDLSAAETVDRIKDQGGIVGVPHPFDHLRSALEYERMVDLIGRIDFIEALNARIVFPSHNQQALEFARKHGKPVSAASDAHSPREIGRACVEMPAFTGRDDFLASLAKGRLVGHLSSPLIHMVSRYAKLRHALGWDPQ